MYRVYMWPIYLLKSIFEWLFADKRTRKMLRYVPETCLRCELLGICRDEHNRWRCRRGCLALREYRIPDPARGGESGAKGKGAPGRTK